MKTEDGVESFCQWARQLRAMQLKGNSDYPVPAQELGSLVAWPVGDNSDLAEWQLPRFKPVGIRRINKSDLFWLLTGQAQWTANFGSHCLPEDGCRTGSWSQRCFTEISTACHKLSARSLWECRPWLRWCRWQHREVSGETNMRHCWWSLETVRP